MAHYVPISHDEMVSFLQQMGFVPIVLPSTYELVMARRVRSRLPLTLRVYTTIAGMIGRESGEDAIRVALVWRDEAGQVRAVKSFRRVHRVEGWRANLTARIAEASVFAPLMCPQCGAVMVARESKRGPFWGCGRFPSCRATRPNHEEK